MKPVIHNDLTVFPYFTSLANLACVTQRNGSFAVVFAPETADMHHTISVYGYDRASTLQRLVEAGLSRQICDAHGSRARGVGYVCCLVGDHAIDAMCALGLELAVQCHRCGTVWREHELAEDEHGHYCPRCPEDRAEYASLTSMLIPSPAHD